MTRPNVIVVLSDHGESLGENHYWFEHGRNAYEATIRVPLLIVPPADRSLLLRWVTISPEPSNTDWNSSSGSRCRPPQKE